MVDIASLKPKERTIEIKYPGTDDRFGLRVHLMHVDDERMTKLKRGITDRRLYLEARGKTFKAQEIEENRHNILFGAMTGWEWYNPTGKEGDEGFDPEMQPEFEGSTNPEFNRKTVIALMNEVSWFPDQVNEALGETKDFFDHSKPS